MFLNKETGHSLQSSECDFHIAMQLKCSLLK